MPMPMPQDFARRVGLAFLIEIWVQGLTTWGFLESAELLSIPLSDEKLLESLFKVHTTTPTSLGDSHFGDFVACSRCPQQGIVFPTDSLEQRIICSDSKNTGQWASPA